MPPRLIRGGRNRQLIASHWAAIGGVIHTVLSITRGMNQNANLQTGHCLPKDSSDGLNDLTRRIWSFCTTQMRSSGDRSRRRKGWHISVHIYEADLMSDSNTTVTTCSRGIVTKSSVWIHAQFLREVCYSSKQNWYIVWIPSKVRTLHYCILVTYRRDLRDYQYQYRYE